MSSSVALRMEGSFEDMLRSVTHISTQDHTKPSTAKNEPIWAVIHRSEGNSTERRTVVVLKG
jgi:hypothetical protein